MIVLLLGEGMSVTDPITTSIATALATAATTALTDGSRTLIAKLTGFLVERFRRDPSDREALEAARDNPEDRAAIQRLAELLDRRMREDPVFAQRLRALWFDVTAAEGGSRDDVSNTVSGQVHGSVVQARDVSGGITFHDPGRSDSTD
ncbi:hypothetical protein [Phytohabitans kaempferiae]|uniref:SMODS and SLOG-associating 2TM effector domain-containing protein n=1 Tax=Phytohabitans kaempferiae TaxID=1620943 RepID=A0ABV6LW42_9ACTN